MLNAVTLGTVYTQAFLKNIFLKVNKENKDPC